MFEIMVEDTFDAAHCLRGYQGKCERLHGHTYRVQVAIRHEQLGPLGMAADFRLVKESLAITLDQLDHTNINELPAFLDDNSTAENIAKFIYDDLAKEFSAIHKVTVWETPTSAASYWVED